MDLPDIEKLSSEQKRLLLERLVASMSAESTESVPEWQIELARESLAEYKRSGEKGAPARETIEHIFRNL